MIIARRASIASRALTQTQPSSRFSKVFFSDAFERAEGSNTVADAQESGNETSGTSGLPYTAKETVKEGLYEAKHQGLAMTSDIARDGSVKATEMAETVGDTAKRTMDGAWKASRKTAQQIKDAALGRDEDDEEKGPNHESLHEDSSDSIEDLRRRAGGYDKSGHC